MFVWAKNFIEIENIFHSKAICYLSRNLHTSCVSAFKVNCFLNKKRLLSSKNIHQRIDLIDLIDTSVAKVVPSRYAVV